MRFLDYKSEVGFNLDSPIVHGMLSNTFISKSFNVRFESLGIDVKSLIRNL